MPVPKSQRKVPDASKYHELTAISCYLGIALCEESPTGTRSTSSSLGGHSCHPINSDVER